MGKKNKNLRRTFDYTQAQFVHNVCKKCGICHSEADRTFCYDTMYMDDPKLFISKTFNRLLEISKWKQGEYLSGMPESIPDMNFEHALNYAFCNFCKDKVKGKSDRCEAMIGCLFEFRRQVLPPFDNSVFNRAIKKDIKCVGFLNTSSKNSKIKKKEARIVVPAKPTFFCNDRLKEELKELLNGDDPQKQD